MLLGVEVGTTARPVSGRSGTARVRQKRDKVVVVSYRSILAGAALVLASTATVSADGYRGMKDMPVVYSQPASWYLRGDFSYSWMNVGDVAMPSFGFTEHGNDNTWAAGGGVGYYFGRGIRGDVTYEWRGGIDIDATTPTASTDLSVKSSVLLANLYYDFRAGERLTPYVGVGLGVARHDTSGGSVVRPAAAPASTAKTRAGRRRARSWQASASASIAAITRPSASRTTAARSSPAGCTSMSATASSISATPMPARSSM